MLWRNLKVWQIYGANTDVGKTIVSTVLCKALARRSRANELLYLKPISTGPDNEADDTHIKRFAPGVISQCLKQYSRPLSPHLAAQLDEGTQLDLRVGKLTAGDHDILTKIKNSLNGHQEAGGRYGLLETAGGVLSPGPSGSVQADLYRPLRLPILLVGDAKLGGIGTTISAFESLSIRGYDVESIVLLDLPEWGNADYLGEYFAQKSIDVFKLPPPPARDNDEIIDRKHISEYYDQISRSSTITQLVDDLHEKHFQRISKLTFMPSNAESIIWHPFRQYGLQQNVIAIDSAYENHFSAYNQETDSAAKVENSEPGLQSLQSYPSTPLLTPLFDASASWWTQGLGHGNPNLSLAAANAAGRYGHVMFANAVHEPALDLCYNLLEILRNPRLSRVFFTDNGSAGMEVAVKMALRSASVRYRWDQDKDGMLGILGLRGSYHGDTIGAMNCSEPSAFNEKVDWYKPWGYWFSPPEVKLVEGVWTVTIPAEQDESSGQSTNVFNDLTAIFDFEARQAEAGAYTSYITRILTELCREQKRRFGALILEPLVMGAGGMIFVDPLFQRTLITTIRSNPHLINPNYQPDSSDQAPSWSGLPIIADEIFTGLYRLGRPSSSSFWNTSSSQTTIDADIAPDISCHAKLLTGGTLPLALTTASDSIFQTFISDSKADALLHGHSYTAHPMGCAVANESLKIMNQLSSGWQKRKQIGGETVESPWNYFRAEWSAPVARSSYNDLAEVRQESRHPTFSFFSPVTLSTISKAENVESCWALGTVLAIAIKEDITPTHRHHQTEANAEPGIEAVGGAGGGGYSSSTAGPLQTILLTTLDKQGRGVHSRILGNIIYFMVSLETGPDEMKALEGVIIEALNEEMAQRRGKTR